MAGNFSAGSGGTLERQRDSGHGGVSRHEAAGTGRAGVDGDSVGARKRRDEGHQVGGVRQYQGGEQGAAGSKGAAEPGASVHREVH